MNKTKIDWCDSTWNPVTGCLHGCGYCYARRIARRFSHDVWNTVEDGIKHYIGIPMRNKHYKGGRIDPYPYGFDPTFYRYRLDEPQKSKKPQNIFVCSMADLFGEWVPDEWIAEVFKACEGAPQHRYLFLTKNPKRYIELAGKEMLPQGDNYWFGSTATTQDTAYFWSYKHNTFVSIEPILGEFESEGRLCKDRINWVIIGAETGNRKNKVIPKREWIEEIIQRYKAAGAAVFMKESLREIMGESFVREFPWEV